jgi:hypothetical protein
VGVSPGAAAGTQHQHLSAGRVEAEGLIARASAPATFARPTALPARGDRL